MTETKGDRKTGIQRGRQKQRQRNAKAERKGDSETGRQKGRKAKQTGRQREREKVRCREAELDKNVCIFFKDGIGLPLWTFSATPDDNYLY